MGHNFFETFKQKIKDLEEWLKREFTAIRTGRATPAVLDRVKVEAYGSIMSVTALANISIEDSRMIRVTPWDMSQIKVIEKGILLSDLGLSVAVDDNGIRLTFPELTSDRRHELIKIAKVKLEDARITLRAEREKVLKDIEREEKEGKISKDDKFRLKTELQKMVDEVGNTLDGMFSKKEREISE